MMNWLNRLFPTKLSSEVDAVSQEITAFLIELGWTWAGIDSSRSLSKQEYDEVQGYLHILGEDGQREENYSALLDRQEDRHRFVLHVGRYSPRLTLWYGRCQSGEVPDSIYIEDDDFEQYNIKGHLVIIRMHYTTKRQIGLIIEDKYSSIFGEESQEFIIGSLAETRLKVNELQSELLANREDAEGRRQYLIGNIYRILNDYALLNDVGYTAANDQLYNIDAEDTYLKPDVSEH